MKRYWHEQIQRYVAGESTQEETISLQQALKDDAELRALYLDYLNLDVALGAAAEEATMTGNEIARMATYPGPFASSKSHCWRWIAAAGACAALVVLTNFPRHRDSSRARYDFGATISSTQNAIARLSFEPTSSFPGWMSPTASMLEPPDRTK
jgi:hypothetical protein